ncbi:MAG: TetR/AcrR family transcriptional regulator [Candidatus Omnitrophica bacterium]|nr:TetR/AcrR family transcriptional regulator [Candidatus Omnitrophota bacterium]MDD5487908.1 TetR/AcrR family transcriptional regulator [Candidatus Omnitrophota bacterium]
MLAFEEGLSLRERKQAKTKVLLAQEFLNSLKDTKYEDVPIRSICERAEVSEGTFYNYFPQKADIFNYILTLYDAKSIMEADEVVSRKDPIKWIEKFFGNIVGIMLSLGNMTNEIFAVILKERFKPQKISIPHLEFLYMFPEMEGKGAMRDISHEDCLEEIANEAILKGLIKDTFTKRDMVTYLKSILGGLPFMRIVYKDEEIANIVSKQLLIFWNGVRK